MLVCKYHNRRVALQICLLQICLLSNVPIIFFILRVLVRQFRTVKLREDPLTALVLILKCGRTAYPGSCSPPPSCCSTSPTGSPSATSSCPSGAVHNFLKMTATDSSLTKLNGLKVFVGYNKVKLTALNCSNPHD